MIDVTATMLPSTVMNDRSLADQIASSAIRADSAKLRIGRVGQAGRAGQAGRTGEEVHIAWPFDPPDLLDPPDPPDHPSYLPFFALSTFTRSPSAMPRTELYGPVITWSPGLIPEATSKYLSPAIPILIGMNSARPSRITNTPSTSLRVCPGFSSAAEATVSTLDPVAGAARRRFGSRGSFTT